MTNERPNNPRMARRPRRLRLNEPIRQMVRDVRLNRKDLIAPLFVIHGNGIKNEISSMPGQFQFSVDRVVAEAGEIFDLGIPAVMLFGIPGSKDSIGSDSFDDNGIVQQAIWLIKKHVPGLIVISDACLCEYTDHGHCGVLHVESSDAAPAIPDGYVLNDETLEILRKIAVSQAQAGADIIAPSGMIDGMVGAIRNSLDQSNLQQVSIMSYSVKYASAFYGPFRDAADGAPEFGDRRSHQMDPAEKKQALMEAKLDAAEGADYLMVKPALAYLDVIAGLRQHFPEYPLVAYNVSGEYSMIKAASQNGWLDEKAVVLESLTGIRRAGADLIITYHAKEICQWLET